MPVNDALHRPVGVARTQKSPLDAGFSADRPQVRGRWIRAYANE